ncbi:putative membrane protein [Winogradskyella epiphytica]|uniref:Putative membrane protein n=1 Tax=Winogradskyella epiphytica TaxID=262005 RepID=A0A2V4WVQ5_9FLAO|nr:DUF368 domain-containing protein [Winogradskyella epiphytica]PYE81026.1 putative membrane protein [Winogradskyella epiphytica]GGW66304.1 DUF368 domain-containing protein [Winogradskyella epiphytica]
MQRRFLDYLVITLKGAAMGAADAVPGVSGGTIAFISGIYEELITTISNVNLSTLKVLKKEGFPAFWKKVNGNFILALLIGIIISFASFMKLAKYLIEQHPILIWSFFFGLIIASIYFVAKQITKWNAGSMVALVVGSVLAYFITSLPSMASNDNPYFLFFAGAIAICAMILPGISGSFILVILGAYKTLSDAIDSLDLKKIIIFALGAVVGLLSFSRVLKWLFKNYHNTTLAVLTGFIFGSLNKIWPWKKTVSVMSDSSGEIIPFSKLSELGTLSVYQKEIQNFDSYKTVIEKSILPNHFSEINGQLDAQILFAVALMIAGFSIIFILEKIGNKA